MKHYSELIERMILGELTKPEFITKRKYGDRPKTQFANIEVAFDIETSSIMVGDEKNAHMYVWMFGMGFGEPVYYGNTFEEFHHLCSYLADYLDLSDERHLVIYCHNLSYEFQFIKDYFDWTSNQIHIDKRKPLSVTTTQGIQFRCSLSLSGMSLANTARNLTKYKVLKAEGDLDYDLIRNPNTPLTAQEINYCVNDIHVVLAYIKEEIEKEGDIIKIPLTKTGRVRKYMRNLCYKENVDGSKKKGTEYKKYRGIMMGLTMEPDVYKIAKRAFMGGFTHANSMHVERVLHNVTSVDFSSAYPSVMVSEKFPMSTFERVKPTNNEEFELLLRSKAVLFDIEFVNIRPRTLQENYISKSKCTLLENPIINNGRVDSADVLKATLTEVDFAIMNWAYEWDGYKVSNVFAADKDYLPKPIIEGILELYKKKTVLKGVEGRVAEYNLSKEMLNSVYGMCVTDPVKTNHIYTDKWEEGELDLVEALTKHNESKSRFLYFPWGVWTTAYARWNLWTGIVKLGDDYIYSDTDSIKLFNYEKHLPYFDKFNERMIRKIEKVYDAKGLDPKLKPELIKPKTIKGEEKPLGEWDYEGTYERFKTLGAKRYAQQEGDKFSITVAGLSKKNGKEYILELSGNDIATAFEKFEDGLLIPADRTGKLTHNYFDYDGEERSYLSTDYLGESEEIHTKSSVHLEDVSFELTLSDEYMTYLAELETITNHLNVLPEGTVRQ